MFQYYFMLGLRSLRRNPALTALMVLTLAVGVAASVSTLTILHVMSGDPIPQKSERLLAPIFDVGPAERYVPGEELNDVQLAYPDVANLLKSGQGVRRAAVFGVSVPVEPARKDLGMFTAEGMAPSRDFFAMFDTPFLHGSAWSEADDAAGADVVVLGRKLSEKLFGSENPVGKRITMMGKEFQVTGVLDHWMPLPRFYRPSGGNTYGATEDFFMPFSSAIRHEMNHNGNMNCSARRDPGFAALLKSECTWIQFWFETQSAADRVELKNYLTSYSAEQTKLGRHQRKAPVHLYNVMQFLEFCKVVGNDSRLSAWLALGFLVLCLVNTIGLLLAKFSVRAAEVGIRRALGASRREIFQQFLTETAVIGLAGGVLGLLLAFAALALIGMASEQLKAVTHMDLTMLAMTFVISVLAAVLAGLLPTWRACQVTPALQLKSQ
jgi:putative ABC transport system permease protein